jgi:signal transduction histidine kinase
LTATFSGHGGKVVGIIQLIDKLEGEFTDEDEALLRQLASMAGVAMENTRLYEELRQRDQRKDEFLATLAHELRNPLAPIGSALEILRLAQDEEVTSAQARKTIDRQFRQLVRLVDDLLDVSRITQDRIDLRKERVALAEVVHSALEASCPIIGDYGHTLTVTLPEDPLWLEVDPIRLAQVIENLLNNAAKYTPERGHIMLTAERERGQAVIKVRDTGIGISAERLMQVFDLFARVDTSLERSQGGLGIGLFLVKKLVEMHGGRVEAHSAGREQGAEFIVRLPLASQDQVHQGAAEEAGVHLAAPLPARRVLVVDDNRDAAESLAALLKKMGHEVDLAFDGPAALEAARHFKPDLVLMDIGLPGLSGYEVAQRIREQPELREVVLVAVTGWGQEEDRRRAREAGFDLTIKDNQIILAGLARALNKALTRVNNQSGHT